ncbi:Acetyltransferase Pat [Paludisphaera borealis]|uniref:Acetyltransferase Pat n=1 Tax=Paludisphaera borealis TaxID=1387353 RepID=A0A1U7CNN6_9BACT|nr:Acetyltransferase Pat [Paludisphaera borealis]
MSLADAVRRAYQSIEAAVRERVRARNFQGATVQPMIKLDGYELIVGSSCDPALHFGTGAELVEVFKDRALGLPPLNTTLARRMMERTRIYTALQGGRGRKPVNLAGLERILVKFRRLDIEQDGIREIDINPLLASPNGLLALDVRVVDQGPDAAGNRPPGPAIRPHPSRYVIHWSSADGTSAVVCPIWPEDEPLVVEFHRALSYQSGYSRYFQVLKLGGRVTLKRLSRICFIDYDRDLVLVADHRDPVTGAHQIVGGGRLGRRHGSDEAEFALIIRDESQGRGLGPALLRELIGVARDEGLRRIAADILAQKHVMQHVCSKLGFRFRPGPDTLVIRAELDLAGERPDPPVGKGSGMRSEV